MKIAYVSNGESVHDRRFLKKMVEYGHHPLLISYYGNKLVQVDGVETFQFNYRRLFAFNRFVSPMLDYQLEKKLFTFQVGFHLRQLLNKLKPDVLHTNFLHYEGFCGALSGFRPVISMPWGSDILLNPRKSRFDMLAAKYTLKRADMIACDCEVVKGLIMKLAGFPGERIEIFPCGVELNIFFPSDSGREIRERFNWQNKLILIMNRNFKEVYGVEYFIEALPYIFENYPEVRVFLIGDGPDKNKYRKRIEELGLKEFIWMIGHINEKEMAKFLNASDIYISTSLSDGTSVSLLEAMACRLPVVVSDVPANLEWVKNSVNGFVVPRKDSAAIGKAILDLLNDKKLREIFGDRNLIIAKKRADWDKNYEKLESMYKKIKNKFY